MFAIHPITTTLTRHPPRTDCYCTCYMSYCTENTYFYLYIRPYFTYWAFTDRVTMKVALRFHCASEKLNSRRTLMYLRGLLLYGNFYRQPVPCYHGNLSLCSGARDSDQLQTQDSLKRKKKKTNKERKCKLSTAWNIKVMRL